LRAKQVLIVDPDLDDFTFETNDGFKFLAVMFEVDFVDLLAPVFLFFDFGNFGSGISFFDDCSDVLFTNRSCRSRRQESGK